MVVAFDLDDTLVPEINFVQSAVSAIGFRHKIRQNLMTGETLAEYFDYAGIEIPELLEEYRSHAPAWLPLPWASVYTLETLRKRRAKLYLVTDGRSLTQRAKINALRLDRWFAEDSIFISQEVGESKTSGKVFRQIAAANPGEELWMVGDNPEKDFATAAREEFKTVCLLDSGLNIHAQRIDESNDLTKPQFTIRYLVELTNLVCS